MFDFLSDVKDWVCDNPVKTLALVGAVATAPVTFVCATAAIAAAAEAARPSPPRPRLPASWDRGGHCQRSFKAR